MEYFNQFTITELEQLSDFYILDLADVMDEEGNINFPETNIFGLKPADVHPDDYVSLAQFGRIVKNYRRIKRISKEL